MVLFWWAAVIIGWLLYVYFFQVNNVFSAVIVAAVHVDMKAMRNSLVMGHGISWFDDESNNITEYLVTLMFRCNVNQGFQFSNIVMFQTVDKRIRLVATLANRVCPSVFNNGVVGKKRENWLVSIWGRFQITPRAWETMAIELRTSICPSIRRRRSLYFALSLMERATGEGDGVDMIYC